MTGKLTQDEYDMFHHALAMRDVFSQEQALRTFKDETRFPKSKLLTMVVKDLELLDKEANEYTQRSYQLLPLCVERGVALLLEGLLMYVKPSREDLNVIMTCNIGGFGEPLRLLDFVQVLRYTPLTTFKSDYARNSVISCCEKFMNYYMMATV